MFNIVLFGAPGTGKGTQSEQLIAKYGFIHLSTGNLLRDEITRATPLGLEAKSLMDKGQLVPDSVVVGMISSCIEDNPDAKGFLFDGFPRTVAQAEALDGLLAFKKQRINLVLALEVEEDELVQRILKRGETSGRSDDTNEELIRNRFNEYQNKTAPVGTFYAKQNKKIAVKGKGEIETIFNDLCKHIDENIANEEAENE
jgi:adenylate kinase